MEKPYTFKDFQQVVTTISPDSEGAWLKVADGKHYASALIPPSEVERASLALHEAAGLPRPVILPAAEIDSLGTADKPVVIAGYKLWRDHRGVHLASLIDTPYDPQRDWTLPANALRIAAVLAQLAARFEPDPQQVEEVADVLHTGGRCCSESELCYPGHRVAARAALLWMRDQKTDDRN